MGACSGCPSSLITLKEGIERALQEVWGDIRVEEETINNNNNNINKEEEEEEEGGEEKETLNKETILNALSSLINPIKDMGGNIYVNQHPNGEIILRYVGPNALTVKYGLQRELQDKLPKTSNLITIETEETELPPELLD
ncbi:hypothetical protein, conserved [Eimeria maxima]|uniref:NIF system FeS cluster assembly NifU C-terminal domain-containing protein n=1 Tax=Eimeria maxima TaxID=5804 RepID=U6M4C0_EIMMA|nr:hypothetical protein, conserved [Eimeria maxima]CDJ57928.1 hypothetical protein, conserved [Eimeria maxima]